MTLFRMMAAAVMAGLCATGCGSQAAAGKPPAPHLRPPCHGPIMKYATAQRRGNAPVPAVLTAWACPQAAPASGPAPGPASPAWLLQVAGAAGPVPAAVSPRYRAAG